MSPVDLARLRHVGDVASCLHLTRMDTHGGSLPCWLGSDLMSGDGAARLSASGGQHRGQVILDGLEDVTRDSLGQSDAVTPCDLRHLARSRDTSLSFKQVARHVGQVYGRRGMHPLTEHVAGDDRQASLLERFPDSRDLGGLARFDLAARERPQQIGLGHTSPDEQDLAAVDDDRRGDGWTVRLGHVAPRYFSAAVR